MRLRAPIAFPAAARRAGRRRAAPTVACLAVAALGLAVPAAQAAQTAPATPAAPAASAGPDLTIMSSTDIGSAAGVGTDVFAETPAGGLYVASGTTVQHACGRTRSGIGRHARPERCRVALPRGSAARKRIIALAATSSDIFVQIGLTVTERSEPSGKPVRHWTLTSPAPVTSAGLLVAGTTLWSWTDWATDSSGFEFARISRISTKSSAVHVVNKLAFPGDVAAGAAGLYFEAQRGSSGELAHVTPSGHVTYRRSRTVDAPLALSGGRVDMLAFGTHGVSVDTFSATSLALLSSKPVSDSDRVIAGTSLGLLVLTQPCPAIACANASVSLLDAATGAASGTVTVPHARVLLPGPVAEVISVSGGKLVLNVLGA